MPAGHEDIALRLNCAAAADAGVFVIKIKLTKNTADKINTITFALLLIFSLLPITLFDFK